MKISKYRKIIAVIAAFSLAFLQVMPSGWSEVAPRDTGREESVAPSADPFANSAAQAQTQPPVAPTTIDALMDTGGISTRTVTSSSKPAGETGFSTEQLQVADQMSIDPETISNFVYAVSEEESKADRCRAPGCQVQVGYASFVINGVKYVARISYDRAAETVVNVIQTELEVEAVRAIASHLEIGFRDIAKIDSEKLPFKATMASPEWGASITVTTSAGSVYEGTISQQRQRDDSEQKEPAPYVVSLQQISRVVTAEELQEATDIFGSRVVSGTVHLSEFPIGGGTVIDFYDAEGNLVGRHVTNNTVTPPGIDDWYKINKKGELKKIQLLGPEIPSEIQDYIRQLITELSSYKLIKIVILKGGGYRIVLRDPNYALGHARRLVLDLKAGASGTGVQASLDLVKFDGFVLGEVDGKLLYRAMGACPQGQECALLEAPNPVDFLKKLTEIKVTKIESGAIFYTHGDVSYKAYWENGQVKVEEIVPLPAAVQAILDTFDGYIVDINDLGNGNYSFSISDHTYPHPVDFIKDPERSRIGQLTFQVNSDGKVDPATVRALYDDWDGGKTFSPEGRLLFEGIKQLPVERPLSVDPDLWALKAMIQIKIINVDDKKVVFEYGKIQYYCRYDANNNIILTPISDKPLLYQASEMVAQAAASLESAIDDLSDFQKAMQDIASAQESLTIAIALLREAGSDYEDLVSLTENILLEVDNLVADVLANNASLNEYDVRVASLLVNNLAQYLAGLYSGTPAQDIIILKAPIYGSSDSGDGFMMFLGVEGENHDSNGNTLRLWDGLSTVGGLHWVNLTETLDQSGMLLQRIIQDGEETTTIDYVYNANGQLIYTNVHIHVEGNWFTEDYDATYRQYADSDVGKAAFQADALAAGFSQEWIQNHLNPSSDYYLQMFSHQSGGSLATFEQLTAAGLDLQGVETAVITDAQLAEFLAAMKAPGAQFSKTVRVPKESIPTLPGEATSAFEPTQSPFPALDEGEVQYTVSVGDVAYALSLDMNHPDGARWVYTKVEEITKDDALAAVQVMEDSEQKQAALEAIQNAPDGTHFYKVTDGTENVSYQWIYPPPMGLEVYASKLSGEAQQKAFLAALADGGLLQSITYYDNGGQTWVWPSKTDSNMTYSLQKTMVATQFPDGHIENVEEWFFVTEVVVSADEVRNQLGLIVDPAMRVAAEAAINTGDGFIKIVAGNDDPVYQWKNPSDPNVSYSISLNLHVPAGIDPATFTTEAFFSIMETVPINEAESFAQNIPEESRQAFLDAINQAKAAGVMTVTKITAVNSHGEDVSYSWQDPAVSSKTYTISIYGPNGEVSFSITMRVNPSTVVNNSLAQYAENLTDEVQKQQFLAALQDVGPNSEFSIQIGENGSQSWIWTSADGLKTYVLAKVMVGILQPDQTIQMIEKWSFSTETKVNRDEVLQFAPLTLGPQNLEFLKAVDRVDSQGFRKIISGKETSYRWGDSQDSRIVYIVSIDENGHVSFSIQKDITQQLIVYIPTIPEGAGTFPSTLMYFNANEDLLRVVDMSAPNRVDSVREYVPSSPDEKPAKVIVYAQGSSNPFSEIHYDTQGNVLSVVNYQYDWNSLPKLPAPADAVILPSTDKHYDANGILIRELQINAQGQVVSMTTYNSTPASQLPVRVDVYTGQGEIYSSMTYDEQGRVISIEHYKYGAAVMEITRSEISAAAQVMEDSALLADIQNAPSNTKFYKVTDAEGHVTYYVGVAAGLRRYAENLTDQAQKAQLLAVIDSEPNAQYSIEIDSNGGLSLIWKSVDGTKTYVLAKAMVGIMQPDQTVQIVERWSFVAQSQASRNEVLASAAQLPDSQRAVFESAIADLPLSTIFTKTVSGSETVYNWEGMHESRPAVFMITVGPEGLISFSIQQEPAARSYNPVTNTTEFFTYRADGTLESSKVYEGDVPSPDLGAHLDALKEYDATGKLIQMSNYSDYAPDTRTTFQYNAEDKLFQSNVFRVSDGAQISVKVYDPATGRALYSNDFTNGRTTFYYYNDSNQLIRAETTNGGGTTYFDPANGSRITSVVNGGVTTVYNYNNDGVLTHTYTDTGDIRTTVTYSGSRGHERATSQVTLTRVGALFPAGRYLSCCSSGGTGERWFQEGAWGINPNSYVTTSEYNYVYSAGGESGVTLDGVGRRYTINLMDDDGWMHGSHDTHYRLWSAVETRSYRSVIHKDIEGRTISSTTYDSGTNQTTKNEYVYNAENQPLYVDAQNSTSGTLLVSGAETYTRQPADLDPITISVAEIALNETQAKTAQAAAEAALREANQAMAQQAPADAAAALEAAQVQMQVVVSNEAQAKTAQAAAETSLQEAAQAMSQTAAAAATLQQVAQTQTIQTVATTTDTEAVPKAPEVVQAQKPVEKIREAFQDFLKNLQAVYQQLAESWDNAKKKKK